MYERQSPILCSPQVGRAQCAKMRQSVLGSTGEWTFSNIPEHVVNRISGCVSRR